MELLAYRLILSRVPVFRADVIFSLSRAVIAVAGWWLSDSFQPTAEVVYGLVETFSQQKPGESAIMLAWH